MSDVVYLRYGAMGYTGGFTHALPEAPRCGRACVARTDRGLEIGTVVCVRAVPEAGGEEPVGRILRLATDEDLTENEHIIAGNAAKFKFCGEEIKRLNLPMKLVDMEHLFGGDKIIFYFVADGRVDFRQLVKDLAREYQTRIELRQIGVRDEARLLGDYERCGRPICCRTWIKQLEPVSMRMAKNQKATLDPSKISGRCGRLMCCLRYEDATYEDLKRRLPRKGTRVGTPRGPAVVLDTDILTQLVSVENEQGRRFVVPVEKTTRLDGRGRRRDEADQPQGRDEATEEPQPQGSATAEDDHASREPKAP